MSIRILFILGLLLCLAQAWISIQQPGPAGFMLSQELEAGGEPVYQEQFASGGGTREVHSAGVVELSNGDIRSVWYGGTREGHADVAIYTNVWDATSSRWGREQIAIDMKTTRDGTGRYSRKLGNPVITRGSDDELWLFYVSAVGGWATSSINLAISRDEGESWGAPRRLITSPSFNFSTLVKGKAVHFSDGSIGLPVYHEFLAKFGELLRLDTNGEVIDKARQSWGRNALQPEILPYGEHEAIALLRYAGDPPRRIMIQSTQDTGLTWPSPAKTTLPNPNAAITGVEINHGKQFLMVFNNDPEERGHLTLAISGDQGASWRPIHTFELWDQETEHKNQGYSYPSLIQTKTGGFHLVYSWNVEKIKHVYFNRSWLESRL
jgi:predicted neuraminidase